ncbi:MAG TPA: hypothetical protein VNA19_09375 [Pyrinomonadaceae bacterium]|nr:hypothetical protein [Pyrinomonadaceae bacterium]
MKHNSCVDLRNQYVRFKISDIYIPDPLIVLYRLHGKELLRGRVVDMSDSGTTEEAYAVVEVDGMEQRMIVPVDRILTGE